MALCSARANRRARLVIFLRIRVESGVPPISLASSLSSTSSSTARERRAFSRWRHSRSADRGRDPSGPERPFRSPKARDHIARTKRTLAFVAMDRITLSLSTPDTVRLGEEPVLHRTEHWAKPHRVRCAVESLVGRCRAAGEPRRAGKRAVAGSCYRGGSASTIGTAGSRSPGCPPSIRCCDTRAAASSARSSSARAPVSRLSIP